LYTGVGENLIGKTSVGQFAALIKCSDLFFGPDSLGFHISQAVETQSITLWGFTFPWLRQHKDKDIALYITTDMECAGCRHRDPLTVVTTCKINAVNPPCIRNMTPSMVISAISDRLDYLGWN